MDGNKVERLMKKCQIGIHCRASLDDANDLLAECYGTIGRLHEESVIYGYMADMWVSTYFTNGIRCPGCNQFVPGDGGPNPPYCKVLEDGLDSKECPAFEDYIEPAFKA